MKRILLILIALNIGLSHAQTSMTSYDEVNPRWFFDSNIGATWQTSDIKTYPGMAFGFGLGNYFYKKPGRALSFAWRFRYLHGVMFGMGEKRSYGLDNNTTFNGSSGNQALNYKDSLGYIFPNYRMEINRYAIELMLSFNRLREKTGIVFNLFGGVGLTQHWNWTDQLDANGNRYNYSLLDSTGTTLSDLNALRGVSSIRELDYESNSDTYTGKGTKTVFMPSVGFELGYQFGNWFSMGVGHKVTFALNDEIDGYRWKDDNTKQGKNDLYHYTNVYFRFYLGKGKHDHTDENNNNNNNNTNNNTNNTNNNTNNNTTNNNNNNNNNNVVRNRPVVHFTNPGSCPALVQSASYQVLANVYYVNNSNQIVFKVNGDIVPGFSYSAATQQFIAPPITLLPGDNIIELKATNEVGSDYKSCVITYQTTIVNNPNNNPNTNQNQVPPPVITVTNPSVNPYTTYSSAINITSTILNVSSASQVNYTVNGVNNTGFFFNPANGSFSSAINLNEGINIIEITATNVSGYDKEVLTINYQKPAVIQPPIVTIYNPNANPYTVNTNSASVNATVLNVASSSYINVTVNGAAYSGFTYNPATQQLSLTTALSPGANVIQITGTNAAGSDSKNTTIIYQEPQNNLPPVVNFVDPNINPYNTNTATKPVKAVVQHVSSSSQVSVKLNGTPVTGFSFISTTGEVNFNANLVAGANVVEVKGTNPYGTDNKSTIIIYNKPNTPSGQPPVVAINYPLSNPYNTINPNETVTATVLNVSGAGDIAVSFNGTPITSFSYNNTSHLVTLPVTLISGSNIVTFTATNSFGSDSKTTTLIYTPPCDKPVIQNISPATNTVSNTNSLLNFIAHVSNITIPSQLSLTLNGTTQTFAYDAATGTVSANLNLANGNNTLVLTATNNCGNASTTYTISYKKPLFPPVVSFIQPAVNPASVSSPGYTINASVTNVGVASGITYKVNGTASTSFTFNGTTGSFTSNITLVTGSNIIEITGTNADGTDSKSTVIVYAPVAPPCNPPVIALNSPSGTSYNTNASLLNLVATVTNCTGSQVSVTYNGNPVTHTLTGNTLTATINLSEGKYPVVITANNGCDQAIAQMLMVNYTRLPDPPVVTITNPGSNPYTSSSANITIAAKIYKVSTAANVTFKVNGVTGTAFTYNPATNDFSASYVLTGSTTTFEITGTNADGSDSKSVVVNYVMASTGCQKPMITWTSAASGGTTASSNFVLNATITSVPSQSNISVQLNGLPTTFAYLASTGKFTSSATLQPGVNVFTVTATNNCGTVTETYQVTYMKPKVPPVVTITKPAASPYTSVTANYTVEALITNVSNVSGVTCTINGTPNTTFTYVPSTGKFTLPLILPNGTTTVTINAVNTDGSDSKTTVLMFTRPQEACKTPVIHLPTTNASKGTSSSTANYSLSVDFVTSSSQISVKQNGIDIPFTLTGNTVSFTATLAPGLNKFVIKATNNCGSDEQNFNITFVPPVNPPVVNITKPVATGTNVTSPSFAFEASLQHVSLAGQITMTVNGSPFTAFTYNAATGVLTATLTLVNGPNVVVVSASTPDGTASDNTIIHYVVSAPPCQKPSITLPAIENKVSSSNFVLKANVTNITASSQVTIKHNLVTVPFVLSGGFVNATITLTEGVNEILVMVENECGKAEQLITITYVKPKVPGVTITNPAVDGSTVSNPVFPFEASVVNVTSASEITMIYNGVPFTAFTYNNATNKVNASLNLLTGATSSVSITVTTVGGTATDNTTIVYLPPVACKTPVITFSSASGGVVNNPSFALSATVLHTTSANVSIKQNISTVPAFGLSGSALTSSVILAPGKNQFIVTATNDCGTVTETFVVNYVPPVVPPVVNITTPATSGTVVTNPTYNFAATVLNVSNSSQISMTVNSSSFTSFTYNNSTHVLNATLNLHSGNNTVTVNATTPDGSDSKSTVIVYDAPCSSPDITMPPSTAGNINVTNAAYTFNCTVTNCTASQVNVQLNGSNIPFTMSGSSVTANVTLSSGNNTLEVYAQNACGGDKASVILHYTPPCTSAPNASFNPVLDGAAFANPNQLFTGYISGITSASQINAKLNGTTITGFYYNPTNNTFSYNAVLLPGANTFELFVTNPCGTFSKVYHFTCVTVGPPAITYVSPASYPVTLSLPNFTFNGKALNVNSSSELTITMDGANIGPFSFDPASKNLQFNVNLSAGMHNFMVKATNSAGTDTKNFGVSYNPPAVALPAPVINITNPAGGSATVTNPNFILSGTVNNILAASQLQVTVNGTNVSSFIFTSSTKALSVPAILVSGNNTIQITATNTSGSDTKTATINYDDPATKTKITICHYPPGNTANPQTIDIPLAAWAAHQAHGDIMGGCPTNKSLQIDPNKNNGQQNNNQNGNNGNQNSNNTPKTSVAEQEYTKSISRGDQAFNNKNYAVAKAEYQKALSQKPGDKTAADKLKQAEDAIKASQTPVNKEVAPEKDDKTKLEPGPKLNPGLHKTQPNP